MYILKIRNFVILGNFSAVTLFHATFGQNARSIVTATSNQLFLV